VATNVVAVAAGENHSLFVKADGTLWAMGYNGDGELGNGTTVNTNRPVSVASNVVGVAAGQYHSLLVKADGSLWAMGGNGSGQLGNGTTGDSSLPVSVSSNVVAVAAGKYHSLFMKADGTLWAMGYNYYGQLGTGGNVDTNWPVSVAGLTVASLGAMDTAYHSLAVAIQAPQAASLANQAVTVGQAFAFTLVVTNGDGPFTYQWQFNGTNLANATNASYAVASASLADAGTYTVTVTGYLGSASRSASLLIIPGITTQPAGGVATIGQARSLSVTATGVAPLAYQWFKDGVQLAGQTSSTLSFASFQFTNSGSYSVVVTSASGMVISQPALLGAPNASLKAWGYNSSGQLGTGNKVNTSLPASAASNVVSVAAGYGHSLMVETDGTL